MHNTSDFSNNPSQPHVSSYQHTTMNQTEQRATQTLTRHQYELDAFFYAGFGRRFFSYLIDLFILWGITQIILNPIYALTGINEWKLWIEAFSVGHVVDAVLYFAYFVLMTRYFQQTVGKMILGIKVYTHTIQKLNWSDVLYREWIGRIISNVIFGLPYLAVIFTPKHIGVHDYFANTVVVKMKYLPYIKENEGVSREYKPTTRYNSGEL
ncbi:RDD family protein [Staphylococcus lutrae]|uniref:RDD family protein n=1 Tax=Staphylococcus lutrae TaxID=155085 RepID=A0AAC9RVQ2_9STAP|nr:RDD family protein [Staphylococcus lutrae]PNZ36507.1 RDD family protein [Staphylococcus lutrae]